MPDWKIIQPANEQQWAAYYQLRHEVLREPWMQGTAVKQEPDDAQSFHAMISDNQDNALATARIHRVDEHTAQIRFMAVRTDMQGRGLGKAILRYIETIGKKQYPGIQRIILQSRKNALPFYLNNGYHLVEKSFLLFGSIQHYLMEKKITMGRNSD